MISDLSRHWCILSRNVDNNCDDNDGDGNNNCDFNDDSSNYDNDDVVRTFANPDNPESYAGRGLPSL
jgi:hypothetical protein